MRMQAASEGNPMDGRADIERGRAELAEWLPEPLGPLAGLVYNYRWTWMPGGSDLFRELDPAAWIRSGCNPRHLVETTPRSRLRQAAADSAYVARVRQASAMLAAELAAGRPGTPPPEPVAYFCSEFAVHCSLPLYGGGLGVLAGDLLKAASDLDLPMVGVGLLYREGYFEQRLDESGWQHEYWLPTHFGHLPAARVTTTDGTPLTIDIVLRGRVVRVQVWRIDVGRVPLYLLDTDHPANHPIDRWVTARLYVGDRQTRLAQYAVLGIGGVRALEAMDIRPSVFHLNEGHAILGSFELVRRGVERGQSFDAALSLVRESTVFTTHTPVAAGNEGYAESELEAVLSHFVDDLGVSRPTFYDLGRVTAGNGEEPVGVTPLAFRASRIANGVSQRHGELARIMWQPLWPGRAPEDVPIAQVTNGVHTTTWMGRRMQELLDRYLPRDWRARVADRGVWEAFAAVPDDELWAVRCAERRGLVEYVRDKAIRDRLERGEPPDYVEQAAMFHDDTLTIGFARRVATYKRLYLLTRHPERGLALLADEHAPIQLIIAGKAHPQDEEAKATLRDVFRLKRAPRVASKVSFVENYDMHVASRLVAGVDLWINLPRPPLEASGTSGMKVVLNGALNLSVLDGWWAEAYDGENGWAIASPQAHPHEQDDHDAAALMDILEAEVVPLFYRRDADGVPRAWLRRVRASMQSLIPRFSAHRMVAEYASSLYRR
jgi:starch phosphorylase